MRAKRVHAFGIIPIKKRRVLLVHHQKGHWSFPKGHAEENEDPKMTAARELKEETGLDVIRFLEIPPIEEEYAFDLIRKKVTYFFAEVEGKLQLQTAEIQEARWV
ncbi:MAG: NUDIX domain-containing protein, partial [Chlamydiales bacterium]